MRPLKIISPISGYTITVDKGEYKKLINKGYKEEFLLSLTNKKYHKVTKHIEKENKDVIEELNRVVENKDEIRKVTNHVIEKENKDVIKELNRIVEKDVIGKATDHVVEKDVIGKVTDRVVEKDVIEKATDHVIEKENIENVKQSTKNKVNDILSYIQDIKHQQLQCNHLIYIEPNECESVMSYLPNALLNKIASHKPLLNNTYQTISIIIYGSDPYINNYHQTYGLGFMLFNKFHWEIVGEDIYININDIKSLLHTLLTQYPNLSIQL